MANNNVPQIILERVGSAGSPLGLQGSYLIAVVGRGDKKLNDTVIGTPTVTPHEGGLVAGSYVYKVTAVNSSGETCGTNISVIVSEASYVTLSWSSVNGASKYRVYRKLASTSDWNNTRIYETTSLSMTDTNITAASFTPPTNVDNPETTAPTATADPAGLDVGTYRYKITAVTENGESTGSEVRITLTEASYVNLEWDAVVDATEYRVYRRESSDESWIDTKIATVSAPTTTYQDKAAAKGSGTPPNPSTAVILPYNTPTIYYSMGQLRNDVGSGTDLGIAAWVAEKVGLQRLMVVSLDYSSVDAAGNEDDKKAALVVLYTEAKQLLENKGVDFVCFLEDYPEISNIVKTHCSSMYNVIRDRMGLVASGVNDTIGDDSTSGTCIYNARSWNSRVILATYPNSPYLTYIDDEGVAASRRVKGVFNALACGMVKCIIGSPAQQITYKTMSVFDKYDVETIEAQWDQLIAGGITPVTVIGTGVQRIIRGVTTALSSLEDLEMNVVMEEFDIRKTLKSEFSNFIGQIIDLTLLNSIKDRTGEVLSSKKKDVITDFTNPDVYQNPLQLTEVIVDFLWKPKYAMNTLRFRYGFDLTSGVLRAL